MVMIHRYLYNLNDISGQTGSYGVDVTGIRTEGTNKDTPFSHLDRKEGASAELAVVRWLIDIPMPIQSFCQDADILPEAVKAVSSICHIRHLAPIAKPCGIQRFDAVKDRAFRYVHRYDFLAVFRKGGFDIAKQCVRQCVLVQ